MLKANDLNNNNCGFKFTLWKENVSSFYLVPLEIFANNNTVGAVDFWIRFKKVFSCAKTSTRLANCKKKPFQLRQTITPKLSSRSPKSHFIFTKKKVKVVWKISVNIKLKSKHKPMSLNGDLFNLETIRAHRKLFVHEIDDLLTFFYLDCL